MDIQIIKKIISDALYNCHTDEEYIQVIYELGWDYIEELETDEYIWNKAIEIFKEKGLPLKRLEMIQKKVIDKLEEE